MTGAGKHRGPAITAGRHEAGPYDCNFIMPMMMML